MPALKSTVSAIKQFLSQTPPFKVLPPLELERMASRIQSKTYDKGETIYSEGDPADSVWLLFKGRIQIFKYSTQGRPLAIESITPGELFGTLCRLGGGGRTYPCTAVAAVPCEAFRISETEFLDSYNRHPAMVLGVCSLCSQRLNQVQGLSCSSQEPVEKRLAMLLLKLQKKHGATLRFTKRELAEQAGTTVETTIRVMSRFQKKGWIASARGQIQLRNTQPLESLISSVC
jgi:CRP/FNR family transcriptional regulator, nitrogen oxide reductase regulator